MAKEHQITTETARHMAQLSAQARRDAKTRRLQLEATVKLLTPDPSLNLPLNANETRTQAQLLRIDNLIDNAKSPAKIARLLSCKRQLLQALKIIRGPIEKSARRRQAREPASAEFGPVEPLQVVR